MSACVVQIILVQEEARDSEKTVIMIQVQSAERLR